MDITRTTHATTGAEQVLITIYYSENDTLEPITYILVFLDESESRYSFTGYFEKTAFTEV